MQGHPELLDVIARLAELLDVGGQIPERHLGGGAILALEVLRRLGKVEAHLVEPSKRFSLTGELPRPAVTNHPSPVLVARRSRLDALHQAQRPEGEAVDGDPGPPLGIFGDLSYNDSEITLAPGEDVLLYTDGVTEAMNSAREQFTQERLLEILLRTFSRPENMVNTVTEEVKTFRGDAPANDDLTLLAARWEGEDPMML